MNRAGDKFDEATGSRTVDGAMPPRTALLSSTSKGHQCHRTKRQHRSGRPVS